MSYTRKSIFKDAHNGSDKEKKITHPAHHATPVHHTRHHSNGHHHDHHQGEKPIVLPRRHDEGSDNEDKHMQVHNDINITINPAAANVANDNDDSVTGCFKAMFRCIK